MIQIRAESIPLVPETVKGSDLVQKPVFHHLFYSSVYTVIKFFPIHRQTNLFYAERTFFLGKRLRTCCLIACLPVRVFPPCLNCNFQSPDNPLRIGYVYGFIRLWIHLLELVPQSLQAFFLKSPVKRIAEFHIRFRESIQPVADSIYVESAATAHYKMVMSLEKLFKKFKGVNLILPGRIMFRYGFCLDEIMPYG